MKQHIKSVIAILMCAAVVLGVLCALPTGTTANAAGEVTNLLADKNPSFESYTIPGWTITDGAVQCRDEASGTASTYSLKLAKAGASATSTKINVASGKKYTVSAMTKGAAASVEILFFDSEDTQVGKETSAVAASSEWAAFTATFTTPKGTSYAQVKLVAAADASAPAYFDDVSFAEAKANAVTIINADFSQGLTGWSNYTVAETDANDGALHVKRPEGNDKYNVPRQQNIAVDGGANYTLSFDYKQNLSKLGGGDNAILLRVIYYDVDGKSLGQYDYFGAKQLVVEDWTTYTASVTTPANAVKMEVYIYFYIYCEGDMWVDNIAMTPTENANLLTENPGFETLSNTNGFPITNWSSPHGNLYFLTDYDATHGYVARIKSDLKEYWTPVRLLSVAVPVTELATYKASVDVSSLDGFVQLYIRYFANDTDTADSTVIAQAFANSTADAGNWMTISKEFKVPEGAKYARVLLVAVKSGDDANVDVRVDDVRFWQSAAAPVTTAATTQATTQATTAATTAPVTTAPVTTAPVTTAPEITQPDAPVTTAANDTTAGTTNTAPPDSTGDNAGIAAMTAVMILAMTTIVALMLGAKKKNF